MTLGFASRNSGTVIIAIAEEIVASKALLSELDGKIGDGDHGVNMAKGFGKAARTIDADTSLQDGLTAVSRVLLDEIGGSTGPLYGMLFGEMAAVIDKVDFVDAVVFLSMLEAGRDAVCAIGGAKIGDKTMLDALDPGVSAFADALAGGRDFSQALRSLREAVDRGRESTIELRAQLGRASRLGERSVGVADPGATSCCIIFTALADEVNRLLVPIESGT